MRHPETTIPRAIPLALGLVVVLYAVVAVVLLAVLGPAGVAASDAAAGRGGAGRGRLDRGGGSCCRRASQPGRPARSRDRRQPDDAGDGPERDLPVGLARVDVRRGVPQTAEVVVCAVVVLLVVVFDVRDVIGFSSFGVLVYYAVANASAITKTRRTAGGRGRGTSSGSSAVSCSSRRCRGAVVAGACVFAVGVLGRRVALAVRTR